MIVTVKEFLKSANMTKLCVEHLGFTFLAHPVVKTEQLETETETETLKFEYRDVSRPRFES